MTEKQLHCCNNLINHGCCLTILQLGIQVTLDLLSVWQGINLLHSVWFLYRSVRKKNLWLVFFSFWSLLHIRNYSFSQMTINEWNRLSTDCVNASSICIKRKFTQRQNNCWTLDKPMASLSTCHLGLLPWMAISLKFLKSNTVEPTKPGTFLSVPFH